MKQFVALKASAGSGKTFALTVRYISLLLLDANPTQILTLTFTNKAATLMMDRIYETIQTLGEDKAILEAVVEQTQLPVKTILEKKQNLIDKFITSELSIFTIDKFVNKILRQFSGYVNISDDFEIKFDDEELLLYKFLAQLDQKQFFSLVNFAYTQQKKLDSIVGVFRSLLEKNISYSVVEYPFESYKAVKVAILEDAFKIKEFIDKSKVSKSGYNAVNFSTIDELLDKGKTWLTKDSLSEFSYFKKAKPPIELNDILHSLQQNITLFYQIQESFTLKNLFDIFNDFKSFKEQFNKKSNSLEFSDITNITYKLLSQSIDKDFLYFRLDSTYNHILIDEFQDTSTLQYKILSHLIDEILSGDPELFKTFFYVGDTKQSIYRFRGGTKELFDYVAQKYSPQLCVELLDTNYRSGQNVVKFVNDIFLNLPNYEYDKQYVKSDKIGYVSVVKTLNDKDIFYEDIKNQVQYLLKHGVNPSNIAILTYTNGDVLAIYEYLKKEIPNINIVTELTSKLINQPNVKTLINLVKYLYFKEDLYKANFNALIGKDYLEDINITVDFNQHILQILKILAYHYDIVNSDIIRFFEISQSYNTIVDFIYNIDKDDTSVSNETNDGLQILTIFKSKGLEFDSVIVCDRITKKNYDKSALLFEYDNIDLNKIYYKRKNRENLDKFYNNALKKEKQLQISDELNILYVALTRAKYNMIVIKKEKQSVFDLLGDLDIKSFGTVEVEKDNKKIIFPNKSLTYTPLNLGYQDKTKSINNENENIKAKYFGLATHYFLEILPSFDLKDIDTTLLLVKNKFNNILDTTDFDDIKNRVQILLQNKQFQDLIKNSSYTKEQALIYNNEHKIIDLLILKDNQYTIVDYKTTQDQLNSHKIQVKAYMQAIKTITNQNNIKGFVVYLHKNSIKMEKII